MNDTFVSRLLLVIKNRLPIDGLLDLGLDYSQIAILLSELIEKGYIVESDENGFILTDQGTLHLNDLSSSLSINKSSEWILPADEYRIEKIGIFDVYLPRTKD